MTPVEHRYTIVNTKLPREIVLLQGQGCFWKKCSFCDYYHDVSPLAVNVNAHVLKMVTGIHHCLDVINSGSVMELPRETVQTLEHLVPQKGITTLWLETHYLYHKQFAQWKQKFPTADVKFRCGVETFNPQARQRLNKGMPPDITPQDVAKYFKGVCLLVAYQGQNRQDILDDISIVRDYFEYASVNLFCNNSTDMKRDENTVQWFIQEVLPDLEQDSRFEVLLGNTDLGVG